VCHKARAVQPPERGMAGCVPLSASGARPRFARCSIRSKAGQMSDRAAGTAPRAVRENIETILRLEGAFLDRRTQAERVSDAIAAFVGTLWFVLLHLVWFGLWATVNLGVVPWIKPFDPFPFQLLTMVVSMEGVLIATFVLIKQNRMSYLSDRRAHVDLQINLLAEHEITRLLRMAEAIASRVGVRQADDPGELAEDTRVEVLVDALDHSLDADEDAAPKDP
jgi:uncharacterized membrane protein